MTHGDANTANQIPAMTPVQRNVLIVAILASFVAFLDGTVVNLALPAIVHELGGGLAVQQWVSDAYLLTLGSLILLAGSLSDQFGRVRILRIGLIGFGVASLACALAPTAIFLIVARGVQGMAGALLVPSSLAMIISAFDGPAQSRAVGRWTAWSGISTLVGPVIGGLFVDTLSWRWVFGINALPIGVAIWWLTKLPKPAPIEHRIPIDYTGAVLGIVGLGGPVYALIEQSSYGWTAPRVLIPLVVGLAALVAFLVVERTSSHPMMPLSLFSVRNFWVGNLATLGIYGALSLGFFVVTVFLQQVAGFKATVAGLTLLPSTIVMLLLSSYFGTLAGKKGPRFFMAVGPIIAAGGFLLMLIITTPVNIWTQLIPGVMLFGLGLSMTVAPLTSAILGDISHERAGIGSAVNNAVARVAGLLAIAFAGVIARGQLDLHGFRNSLLWTAGLLIVSGAVSAVGISNGRTRERAALAEN